MTRQPGATVKTSLYRLTDISSLDDAFAAEVLGPKSWYERADVVVGGHQAVLVSGAPTSPSKWAPYVQRLTAHDVSFTNSTPRAALVLLDPDGDDGDAWALTWGMGHLLINTEKIEFGFGPGVIARSAISGEIKSVTKTVLDHRARVDRSTLPVGSVIQDFGLDGFGEVVSRLEAKARIPGLQAGDGIIVLSAADSLKIPLAVDPTDLISDLAVLTAMRNQPVVRGLESIEQLVALKPRDAAIPDLEARLIARLRGKSDDAVALSWPHEQLEIYGPALSCKVTGIGDRVRRVSEGMPDIAEVLSWFSGLTPDEAEHRLQAISLQLFSEPEPTRASAVSAAVSLRRWIALEVRKESSRFCFHLGKWYRMDDSYLSRIDERVRAILDAAIEIGLPAWPQGEDERDYNIRAAGMVGGVSLDRKFISTPLHRRGIEPCDIFMDPGNLVCVKRSRSSADLSHLFAQALVAADSLARDETARKAWVDRVAKETNGAITDAGIDRVVLAIGRAGPIDVDSLFTFTKVNLVKQYDALRYIGVDVAVTVIPEQ